MFPYQKFFLLRLIKQFDGSQHCYSDQLPIGHLCKRNYLQQYDEWSNNLKWEKTKKAMKSLPPPQTLLLFSSSTINYSHKGLIPPHTRQTITSESQRTMHMTYSTHRQTVHMANSHIALIPFVNPVRPFPPTVSSPSPPPLHKYHLSPLLSFTSTLTFMNILSSPVSLIATPMKDAQSR